MKLRIMLVGILFGLIILFGLFALSFLKTMGPVYHEFDVLDQDLKNTLIRDIRDRDGRLILDQNNYQIERYKQLDIYFSLRNDLGSAAQFAILPKKSPGEIDSTGKWNGQGSIITCFNAVDSNAKISGNNKKSDDLTFRTTDDEYLEDGSIIVKRIEVRTNSYTKKTTYQCTIVVEEPAIMVKELNPCNGIRETNYTFNGPDTEEFCDDGDGSDIENGDYCDCSGNANLGILEEGRSKTLYSQKYFQISVT